MDISKVYLLYLFWPLRRITKGHEYTVGQNSTHNDHAEKSGEHVKENEDNRDTNTTSWASQRQDIYSAYTINVIFGPVSSSSDNM